VTRNVTYDVTYQNKIMLFKIFK